MIELQLEKHENTAQIRESLLPIYQQTEFDFKWLEPITKFSLDEYLVYYLSSNPPQINKFTTLDLSAHLSEATNLINKCIIKKNEIVSLETQALITAVSYVETINNIPHNETISELNIKGLFKVSGQVEGDIYKYLTAQNAINSNVIKVLKTKLCIHNQKGNSLNFGERIEYARTIYCDNIKSIYEHLFAIKRILPYSFKQTTLPLPNYLEIKNSLDDLIWWLRNTFKEFEFLEQNDYTIEKSIGVKKEDLTTFKKTGILNYEISDTFLDDYFVIKEDEYLRVLALSVSIIVEHKKISENQWYYDQGDYCQLAQNKDLWGTSWADTNNSNYNNEISQDYAVRANLEVANDKLLYISEITPPINEIVLQNDNIFKATKEEEKEAENYFEKLKEKGNKIDWTKVKNIKLLPDGRPKLEFYPTAPDVEKITFSNRFFYGPITPLYKNSINFNKQFYSGNQIKNLIPYGNWEIKVKNVSLDEEVLLKSLEPITNVVLTFKLGVRKFK